MNDRRNWKSLNVPYVDVMAKSDETGCYQLSNKTVAMLLSQTGYLYWHTRWELPTDGVTPEQKEAIFNAAAMAEYQLMRRDDCAGCSDYASNSNVISYHPNDPFTTPELIPPGYILPPWYNNPAIPLPGVLPDDAMVNFASIPVFASLPDILTSGFPRFRVTKEGTGQIEIEFVRVPQGGIALITYDDLPESAEVVNLDSINIGNFVALSELLDIALEPELTETFVHEINFSEAGSHWVDVTFLPNIGEDIVVGFGGGVRRVTLCGGAVMNDCCVLYRLIDGVLYQSEDGGLTFERVPDGGNGPWDDYDPTQTGPLLPELPDNGGDMKCLYAANAAKVYRQLHIELSPYFLFGGSLALAVSGLVAGFGFMVGSGPLAFTAIGAMMTTALALATGAVTADTFDGTIEAKLKCHFYAWMQEDGTLPDASFTGLLADIAAETGIIWDMVYAYVEGMGNVGATNAGRTSSITEADCGCPEDCPTCVDGVPRFWLWSGMTGYTFSWTPTNSPNGASWTQVSGPWWVEFEFYDETRCFESIGFNLRLQATVSQRPSEVEVYLDGVFFGTYNPNNGGNGSVNTYINLPRAMKATRVKFVMRQTGKITDFGGVYIRPCN